MKHLELLLKKVKEEITSYERALIGGDANDYAEYRRLCGIVHGLDIARSLVEDRIKASENDD